MLTLKKSDYRPAFKNQVNFDPHKNQINFIPRLKSSQIRSRTSKSSQLYHPHKHQVNFRAHPKNKWFSAIIQVTSQFLPTTEQPNQFHPYDEIKPNSIPHAEIKSISTITKTKSISMLTPKTVIFDPHTKTRSILTPAQKICQVRSSH